MKISPDLVLLLIKDAAAIFDFIYLLFTTPSGSPGTRFWGEYPGFWSQCRGVFVESGVAASAAANSMFVARRRHRRRWRIPNRG